MLQLAVLNSQMADRRGSVARDQRRGSVTGGGAGNGWRGSITEVTPHDLRMALEEHTAEESELQDLLATYERIAKAGHESKIRAKEGKDNFQPIFIIHLCQAGVPEALVLTANIHVRQRAVVMQFLATSWALIGPAETLEAFQRAGIDQRLETMIRHHRMDPSLVERICKLRTVFVEAKMPRYLRCFAKIVSGEALPAWVTQWYTWLRMDTVDFDFREEQRKLERRDKLQKMAREKREKEEYAAKLANRRESSTGARRASVSPAAGAGRRASAAGGNGDGPDYLAARRSSIADANAAAAKALEAAAGLDENGSSKSYYGGIGDGMDYGMDRISSMTASTADPNSARDTRRSRNGNGYGNDAPRTPSGAWTNESGNNDASSGGAGADDKRRSSVIVGKNGMLTQARRKSEVVALPGAWYWRWWYRVMIMMSVDGIPMAIEMTWRRW